ncbi:MAG TPA: hypothetical protein VFT02_14450 [Pyrinomonadaceae bacterium]|nr:hypothetical protein [Pyrinomonadaceae bacterium]
MQCRDFREVADSYLSDELLVETNHDVIAHLEACAGCRRELAARRELRKILRTSFAKAEELQMPHEFASRLQSELRTAMSGSMSLNMLPRAWLIAALVIIAMTLGALAVWQRQRVQTNSQVADKRETQNTTAVKPSDVQPPHADINVDANTVLAKMSELAAGDHRDCAIGHRLPDRPIPLEEAGRKYDRAYLDLTKAVMSHRDDFNEAIELVMAHACVFRGQWFGHIVVRHRGRLVSLLVTRLEDSGGIATAKEKLPKDWAAQVIACSTAGGFQISCFRTAQHGVFVVSDLEEGENLALARRLAPSLYEHIMHAEQVT